MAEAMSTNFCKLHIQHFLTFKRSSKQEAKKQFSDSFFTEVGPQFLEMVVYQESSTMGVGKGFIKIVRQI